MLAYLLDHSNVDRGSGARPVEMGRARHDELFSDDLREPKTEKKSVDGVSVFDRNSVGENAGKWEKEERRK